MRKGLKALLAMLLALIMVTPCLALAGETKPTLKVLGYNASFDPNADPIAKEIEDRTGYKAEYFMLPAQNANEKLNVELSSGSSYDILMLLASQYHKLVGQGALLPLDDLLASDGEHIMAAIQPETWKSCQLNGQTYAIPYRKEYTKDVTDFILVRKDLMDKAGVAIPRTIDEFYNALVTLKAAYPELIPLTGPSSTEAMAGSSSTLSPTIGSAYGIYTTWQDVDGELTNMLKQPRMKDELSFMSKLYNEGLIDQDWPINTGTTISEKFTSGKAIMMMCNRNTATILMPLVKENFPESELDYILPLEGENGERGAQSEDAIVVYACIPKSSKHAQDTMKFMNLKQEPSNFLYLTLGTEGVDFTRDGEKYVPIMPAFGEHRSTAYWYLTSIDEYHYPMMWMARIRKNAYMWDAFEKVALACADISKPNPIGYMPPNEIVSKYQQSLGKLADDYYLKVIAGVESLDHYDAFVESWDAAGGAEMTAQINAWYHEYYAK